MDTQLVLRCLMPWCTILDNPMLVSMWRKRMRGYRALGWREVTKEQLF
ncbi:MAG: hypothetical protein AB8B63_01695 [Granulosicoccus sp.]